MPLVECFHHVGSNKIDSKSRNYRSLADVSLELKPVNVLFGPSGAGKSSLLDVFGFIRDCDIQGVETASSEATSWVRLSLTKAQLQVSRSV